MNEVEEVKARLDIVEVISGYMSLQKAGRTFKAPCPFHTEKTPSFIVSPDRQSWHCFGACGTGGDVISFVMKREGLEFPEALRQLAERAGVKLQERRQSEEQDKQRARLYAANDAAAEYFARQLKTDAGHEALAYLERRGVDEATQRAFGLGYSSPGWEGLRDHLGEKGFTDRELLSAGLVTEGSNGLHDRFRNRLMFTVWDAKGRIIGFGARGLDADAVPKYINTSQTLLFDKGGTLYALHKAQDAIRQEGRAVVVEGYMDVIAAHQHGFTNVVAQMGTALTERQVRLLKRLTGEIVLALDADAAGSEAMVRGHEVVRETLADKDHVAPVVTWGGLVRYQETVSIDLRVAVLPEGKDPDDVVRADPEKWRALIADARPVLDYRLEAAAASHDLTDPRARSQVVQELVPLLEGITDQTVRGHYVQRLARLAMIDEEKILLLMSRKRSKEQYRVEVVGPTVTVKATTAQKGDPREEFLLVLLLRFPHLRTDGLALPENVLWEAQNQQVMEVWKASQEREAVKEGVPVELKSYVERLILQRLPDFSQKEAREALTDCVARLERRKLEAEKQATTALLATREEELGASMLVQATFSGQPESEQMREAVEIQLRDMETGQRLHSHARTDGEDAVQARIDG